MPERGRLTPDRWGRFMPAHSPLSHQGPWYYRDTECVVIEYATDEEAALAVLPADLELVEPATAFLVVETNHWTTLGPYSEAYVGVLASFGGEVFGYCPGVYVTGENSQIVGREVYGFGKKRAHRIEVLRHDDGSVEAAMDVRPGDGAVRAVLRPQDNLDADAMGGLPLICLKLIPDAAGGDVPALAQLVSVSFTARPLVGSDGRAEVYSGPGTLAHGTENDVALPVRELLSAKYARFHADLPYGAVLKTYTEAEMRGGPLPAQGTA